MVESSCCPATKRTRVVSVERVENEFLWKMYQLRKKEIQRDCAAQGIHSLSTATKWQPAWFCNVKKEKGKGCGKCSQGHTLSVISSSNSWQCDVCSSACNYNPRLRCHQCDLDMCIKCAKAEAEAKEQAAVEAKAAAEAKARAEAEEKAAAEKAAGVRGLLRYIMPSCVYGGGCDEVMFDTIPVLSTQGGGRGHMTTPPLHPVSYQPPTHRRLLALPVCAFIIEEFEGFLDVQSIVSHLHVHTRETDCAGRQPAQSRGLKQ
jgi:hypothetical protein